MKNFTVLPPEINSGRMSLGAGTVPRLLASKVWADIADEMGSAAREFRAVISGTADHAWQGAASAAMTGVAATYSGWLTVASNHAEGAAGQAQAAVQAFEAARASTVHPAAVSANRNAFVSLVRSKVLGLKAPAVAAVESMYDEMWAVDVSAMAGYDAAASAAVAPLTSWQEVLPKLLGSINNTNQNLGAGNVGKANIGVGNFGDGNIGLENSGPGSDWITRLVQSGNNNVGIGNTGKNNIGIGLTDDNQVDINFIGLLNSRTGNIGLFNSGTGNFGFFNSGYGSYGVFNSGISFGGPVSNIGFGNSGSGLIGLGNSDSFVTGIRNAGLNILGVGNTGIGATSSTDDLKRGVVDPVRRRSGKESIRAPYRSFPGGRI